MTGDRRTLLKHKLYNELEFYAQNCLQITTKAGEREFFQFNRAQKHIDRLLHMQMVGSGVIRALLLKGRQQGCSTYVGARYFHKSSTRANKNTFILSHDSQTTAKLFDMVSRFHKYLPDAVKPKLSTQNQRKLVFDKLDSTYTVGTAGNAEVGRGGTLQYFHGCLSTDSLIVMSDGSTKPMAEIRIGDRVVTSSGATALVSAKTYTGDKQTYTLSTWCAGEPIHLTEDHKVLTQEGYKEVKDLTIKDYIAQPKSPKGKKPEGYDFFLENKQRPQGGGSRHKERVYIPYDSEFGYTLGYYLAEGHVKESLGYLTFTYHEDEKYMDRVSSFLAKYASSVKDRHEPEHHRRRTVVNGKLITAAVNALVGRTSGKRIPYFFLELDKEFLEGLLQGYLDGDGSKTQRDKISASSVHEKIARQIQRIFFSQYGGCAVKQVERERYGKKTKDIFVTRISGNTMRRFLGQKDGKRKEKSVHIDGQTFCKVNQIVPRKVEAVFDIEVDHPEHNYQTTVGVVSNSEVAFWDNTDNLDTGLLQSVADLPGTEIILETTANGATGYYFEKCMIAMEGKGDYQLIFIPWFWQEEYRRTPPPDFICTEEELHLKLMHKLDDSQVYWRRKKIEDFRGKKWKFYQEYPCTALEAFQTSGQRFFPAQQVLTAMKNQRPDERNAPHILGVDPSGGGKDEVSFAWRRGRDLYRYEEMPGDVKDPEFQMWIVGKIVRFIEDDDLDMVFIDLGYGEGIVARLYELGYGKKVTGVYFGGGAIDDVQYANKRAEMHDLFREWLHEPGVSIPDELKVQKQILAVPQEKNSSNGRLLLVSKDDVKKNNNNESPNILDSIVLTFAFPVRSRHRGPARIRNVSGGNSLTKHSRQSPLLTMRPRTPDNSNSFPIIRALIGG